MKRLIPLLFLLLAAPGFAPPTPVEAATASAQAHALGVVLMGPTTVRSTDWNSWETVVYGGTPPYQYSWFHTLSGSGTADGAVWEGSFYENGILVVGVRDALGATGQATVYVTVSPW
ncbi:hypothetical protein [Longimicrobium sp.]|uniref:hypothetical protein n=1 Tax=Longimicrobium sp. TaxID=2029185 RepID=UPI003B3B1345